MEREPETRLASGFDELAELAEVGHVRCFVGGDGNYPVEMRALEARVQDGWLSLLTDRASGFEPVRFRSEAVPFQRGSAPDFFVAWDGAVGGRATGCQVREIAYREVEIDLHGSQDVVVLGCGADLVLSPGNNRVEILSYPCLLRALPTAGPHGEPCTADPQRWDMSPGVDTMSIDGVCGELAELESVVDTRLGPLIAQWQDAGDAKRALETVLHELTPGDNPELKRLVKLAALRREIDRRMPSAGDPIGLDDDLSDIGDLLDEHDELLYAP